MDDDPSWGVDSPFMHRYEDAVAFLEEIVADRALLVELSNEQRIKLLKLTGQVSLPQHTDKKKLDKAFRKLQKGRRKEADKQLVAATGLRQSQAFGGITEPFYAKPPTLSPDEEPQLLHKARACYVCGTRFTTLHHFYASMCPKCGDFNFDKRVQTADLSGRVALVTGGRVKIGFCIVLKLLRAGCQVVVLTRFARDAVVRFSKEPDFKDWCQRLQIHGVDLRHTPSVEAFCDMLNRTLTRLDFIVHNACQTVRRPTGFYKHMWKREHLAIEHLRPEEQAALAVCQGVVDPVLLSQIELLEEDNMSVASQEALFPPDVYDVDQQQVDLRAINSWKLELGSVSTTEVVETHLCNAIAPFVMNSRLKPLMENENTTADRHIVNVSAMEGQFYRVFKTTAHPQTNMAKASLNMMTRTSAADYVRTGIHMNSVDTG